MRLDRRITDLYNEYVHTSLPRREFIARLARITGGAAAAAAMLPLLEPDYAHARQVEESDPRLTTRCMTYSGAAGDVKAYSARPRGTDPLPAVIVIHENRGLNAHIEDVARRAARASRRGRGPAEGAGNCTTRAATSGSTGQYRSSVVHSMPTAWPTASTCTREPNTAFTTTRARRGTTRTPRGSRGAVPWRSSMNT